MIYQCRVCRYEEPRGCLPSMTCGVYLAVLLALSAGGVAALVYGLRVVADKHRPAEAPVDAPWWFSAVAVVAGCVLPFAGAFVLNFLFELIEWLAFFRRRCPQCGSRKWSWGETRGFGL
jgi:hypothetical protein